MSKICKFALANLRRTVIAVHLFSFKCNSEKLSIENPNVSLRKQPISSFRLLFNVSLLTCSPAVVSLTRNKYFYVL